MKTKILALFINISFKIPIANPCRYFNTVFYFHSASESLWAENVNVDHSTAFFPLPANKIYFGVKLSTRVATKCPRIEFHDRASKVDTHYLSVSIIKIENCQFTFLFNIF